ncbi:MAG: hypothetical protein IPP72_12745 [Chitinophagaceae bacterium]|nr:hypothetical protein [Chitinophagaceae bacterium]
MKKLFLLATAALLVTGVTFADCGKGKGKKCKKSSSCCKKSGKKCCKKDKEESTTKM